MSSQRLSALPGGLFAAALPTGTVDFDGPGFQPPVDITRLVAADNLLTVLDADRVNQLQALAVLDLRGNRIASFSASLQLELLQVL